MSLFRRRLPETTSTAWDAIPTDWAAKKRRERYHRSGSAKARRKGAAWEDADRRRERYGR